MEESNSFLLVYGSETGQAKSIAEQIDEKSLDFGLHARLHCLDTTGKGVQFNIENESCMVMVTSTTGDGDPPDNASKFLRRIKKKTLASDYLSHLHYTILGLGDTNYNNFCKCPKDMDSRLEQLGAKRFYPTGLADDGVGLEIVVDPWLEGLFPALKKHLEQSKPQESSAEPLTQCVNGLTLNEKSPEHDISPSISNGKSSSNNITSNTACAQVELNTGSNNGSDVVDSGTKISNGANGLNNNNSNSDVSSSLQEDKSPKGLANRETTKREADSNPSGDGICDSSVVSVGVESPGSSVDNLKGAVSSNERNISSSSSSVTSVSSTTNPVPVPTDKIPPIHNSHNKSDIVSSSGGDGEAACSSGSVTVTAGETSSKATPLVDQQGQDLGSNAVLVSDEVERCILTDGSPSLCGKDLTVPVLAPEFLQAEYSVQCVETDKLSFQNGSKLPSAASDILQAKVTDARVLTHPDALKRTLWLKLTLKDQDVQYKPGDSISIICQNNEHEVQLLLKRLKATELAEQTMCLSLISDTKKRRAAVPPHIHPTTTLRHALITCVSIRDVPSKAFLRMLVEYTRDGKEKRRLQELCSKEGANEYTACLREKGVSLLDVLYAFPSCQPPVERVLEFLPRLLPRPYSICSCPEVAPTSLEIVFNIVEIPSDIGNGCHYYSRQGVCTGWMDNITSSLLKSGTVDESQLAQIPMFFRSNQHFQPPSDLSRPLILIGPGTGVAPFVGFLQQRALLKSRLGQEDKYGETWLFTGCRHREKDYLFRESLEEFQATGTLNRLCVSFSRDVDGSSHRYVQDYMKSESKSLARLLVEEEVLVYVCGDAKHMSKDVSAAFQEILVSVNGLTADEASAFVMKKRLHKTYLEDVWT